MLLARFMRAIMFRPIRGAAPKVSLGDPPKTDRPVSVTRKMSVKLDLDTREAKQSVQELLDMAHEAEAILARVRAH